jgi:hypothetical protein
MVQEILQKNNENTLNFDPGNNVCNLTNYNGSFYACGDIICDIINDINNSQLQYDITSTPLQPIVKPYFISNRRPIISPQNLPASGVPYIIAISQNSSTINNYSSHIYYKYIDTNNNIIEDVSRRNLHNTWKFRDYFRNILQNSTNTDIITLDTSGNALFSYRVLDYSTTIPPNIDIDIDSIDNSGSNIFIGNLYSNDVYLVKPLSYSNPYTWTISNTIYDPTKMSLYYKDDNNTNYLSYYDPSLNSVIISKLRYNKNIDVSSNNVVADTFINLTNNKNIYYYASPLDDDDYIKRIAYINDLLIIFLTNKGRILYLYSDNRNGSYAKLKVPSEESFTLFEINYNYDLISNNTNIATDINVYYQNNSKQLNLAFSNSKKIVVLKINDLSQPCFLSITKVLTINNNGEEEYKEISKILPGTLIKTINNNICKVKHCGYTPPFTMMDEMDYPRVIPKDYFGKSFPEEEIYGSGWHCIYLPKDKSYNDNILEAIKKSESILTLQKEQDQQHDKFHKVFIFTLTELKLIKTVQEIQELTGMTTANYYNIELEDQNDGYIVSGLPVESLKKELWEEFKFTDNSVKIT